VSTMAGAIMLNILKTILMGEGAMRVFQRACTMQEEQPMTRVSGNDSSRMPIRTNRKFTDIVPSIPGKFTFKPEDNSATSK